MEEVQRNGNIDNRYLECKIEGFKYNFCNKPNDATYCARKDDPKHKAIPVNLVTQETEHLYSTHYKLNCNFSQANKNGGQTALDLIVWDSFAKEFGLELSAEQFDELQTDEEQDSVRISNWSKT